MLRVCLTGMGKTGKEVAKYLLEQPDIRLVAAICRPGSSKLGRDVGEIAGIRDTGIIVESAEKIDEIVFREKPDVVIDFSSPEATLRNAKVFAKLKVNMVVATTGFSSFGLKKLYAIARRYRNGIVYAPNITLGVNVLMLLSNIASSILNNYDFQITEMHFKNKKDSPSGTAKKIAGEIHKGLAAAGRSLDSDIPVTSVRAGGIIGRHEVMIAGEDDKIEISHEAFSRKAFAAGALKAVRFINKKTGYFEMSDVLNLGKILSEYTQKQGNTFNQRYAGKKSLKEENESFA